MKLIFIALICLSGGCRQVYIYNYTFIEAETSTVIVTSDAEMLAPKTVDLKGELDTSLVP